MVEHHFLTRKQSKHDINVELFHFIQGKVIHLDIGGVCVLGITSVLRPEATLHVQHLSFNGCRMKAKWLKNDGYFVALFTQLLADTITTGNS